MKIIKYTEIEQFSLFSHTVHLRYYIKRKIEISCYGVLLEFVDRRRQTVKILAVVLLLGMLLNIGHKAFFSLLRNRMVKKKSHSEIKMRKGEY